MITFAVTDTHMRRTFLLWLLAVVCTTFLATGALVYTQFARHSRERAEQMMAARLNDMLSLLMHAERSASYLTRVNDASTLDRTRALADIINLRPEILKNQEELQGLCNRLGAEGLTISDENGMVIASVPASQVGYNLAQSDETIPFLDCIEAPGYELSIRTTSADAAQLTLQRAAVHRLDSRGVVILTFRMRVEQEARESESLSRLTSNLQLGARGVVFVFRRGALVSGETNVSQSVLLALPANQALEIGIDNEDYYAYAVDGEGYRLIGAVPAERVHRASMRSVQSLLLSNFILFGIMFAVVSYLLQRYVVRSITGINDSLREITEGNLEKRVDVINSPEFAKLSNGINFMVEALKSLGEEKSQSLNRDLELARTIQTTVLPNKFPAFPNISAFDLYAFCMPARIVGGDFYDFFMTDDRHLHFLVADVDASGIPAALFMMRAVSTIRTLSQSGKAPVDVVTQLNNELCRDSQTSICMALFYGSLDIESGVMNYVNAGGMHVLLQRVNENYEMVPCYTSTMIGEHAYTQFHTAALKLQPEDRLFLYTEGVVHAANRSNTPFGEARLQKALHEEADTVADVLRVVRAALRQHTGTAELQKDVTMLCLEYRGALGNIQSLVLPAGNVQQAEQFLTECLEDLFVAPVDISDMQFSIRSLLEALPKDTQIGIHLDCTEELGRITITWDGDDINPLERVQGLPVDRSYHEYSATDGNKLTIQKKFG